MDEAALTEYLLASFPGVYRVEAGGNSFFMLDPKGMMPFATLMVNDANDSFSNLERPGVYRLNIGVSKERYLSLFGAPFSEEDATSGKYDFTALDVLLPHPVYGRQRWVSVLNPGWATWKRVQELLAEAYQANISRYGVQEDGVASA